MDCIRGFSTALRGFALLAALSLAIGPALADTPAEDYFEAKVRPVLIRSCYGCHAAAQTSGLRVDSREALLKGGSRGPAIVPGKPEESLLVKAIHYDDRRLSMPPPGQISPDEIKAIEQWIRDGAPWPASAPAAPVRVITEKERSFWSYQRPQKPPIPSVHNSAWSYGDIDRFVLAKQEEKSLAPVGDADKQTLIRRLTFDLTGLPPTPEEVKQFVADQSPTAYEKLIDRLLASKAYGERWGRIWLDVVRYADTSGSGADYPVPDAYKYRDWVINAVNDDKPYDEFIREQIAGDLLPSSSEADHWNKIVATGYLAIARREGYARIATVSDALDNVGYAFLGASLACARCHDHKFDPIPSRDYYSMAGILMSTRFPEPGSEPIRYERDLVYRDPNATKSQEYLDFQAQLKPIADSIAAVNELPYFDDILPLLDARRMELYKKQPKFETAYAVAEGTPADLHVLRYGDPKDPGDIAPRGFLQILGGAKLPSDQKGSGRLELAGWIASSDNPLTARVIVNRIWQGHFGKGIVPTPNDFGSRGVPPSNQALLDYLATRFMETGWSMKKLHKEILLSHAYRLSTARDAKDDSADPDNVYLWRHERHRMDAEQIRDSILAMSGMLDTSAAGPQPFPPAYQWNYSAHVPFEAVYDTNRRSVYLMVQRIRQHPYLGLFDAPDPNASTGQRSSNTVALQALYFMNGELPRKAAERMAGTFQKEYSSQDDQLDRAFWTVLGRAAKTDEKEHVLQFLAQTQSKFRSQGDDATAAQRDSLASLIETLFASNEFISLE